MRRSGTSTKVTPISFFFSFDFDKRPFKKKIRHVARQVCVLSSIFLGLEFLFPLVTFLKVSISGNGKFNVIVQEIYECLVKSSSRVKTWGYYVDSKIFPILLVFP